MANCDEFGLVMLTELIIAIMSDGKWYSATALRKRVKPSSRGVITGTLDRMRREGYVIRALNPLDPGRPQHRQFESKYLYKWTFIKHDPVNLILQKPYKEYLQNKNVLPKQWRDVLR